METTTGYKAYEMKNASEDVLRFIKFSLDTTFENIQKLQEFSDRVMRDTIEAGKKTQEEAEKIVNESIENGKKGWNEYRKAVENGFKKVEEMIQPAK